MYIYVPEKLKKSFDTDLAGSHIDIMPTLYDLSLSETPYVSAGTSLLDASRRHIAFNSEGFILSGDKAVLYNISTGDAKYYLFDNKTKTLSETQYTQEHGEMLSYYKNNAAAADIYLNSKQ
jgi:arylsulfatase A-like enzyme